MLLTTDEQLMLEVQRGAREVANLSSPCPHGAALGAILGWPVLMLVRWSRRRMSRES